MNRLFKPRPASAVVDGLDGGFGDTIAARNFSLRHDVVQPSDFADIAFVQRAEVVPFAAIAGAVLNSVHLIVGGGFPEKVASAATAFVALPATVRGVVVRAWRWAMPLGADNAGGVMGLTIDANAWVTLGITRKGPCEAFAPVVGYRDIRHEGDDSALGRSAASRRAVPLKSHIVPAAKPARTAASLVRSIVAIGHRTCFG